MFKLAAVIPTYNNPLTLQSVVDGVKSYCGYVIVVDDGSDKEGAEVANNLREIDLIRNTKNIGKGPSLAKGLKRALEMGFTHVVTIDADGQHFPEEIIKLSEAAEIEPEVLWVGSRDLAVKICQVKTLLQTSFQTSGSGQRLVSIYPILNRGTEFIHCGDLPE